MCSSGRSDPGTREQKTLRIPNVSCCDLSNRTRNGARPSFKRAAHVLDDKVSCLSARVVFREGRGAIRKAFSQLALKTPNCSCPRPARLEPSDAFQAPHPPEQVWGGPSFFEPRELFLHRGRGDSASCSYGIVALEKVTASCYPISART